MKKIFVVVITLGLTVSLLNLADAGNSNGMHGECGNCLQDGAASASDPFRKLQADTIDLRQEMMIKRFDMQRENLKGTPDKEKITALKTEIKVLQTKIMEIRSKSGLPADKLDGECGQNTSGQSMMKGKGGCGKGTGGCNKGPCVQQ
jgi:hypothetical protein